MTTPKANKELRLHVILDLLWIAAFFVAFAPTEGEITNAVSND